MKNFAVILLLATVACALELPPSEVQFLKQVHDACQSNRNTYADEGMLKQLVKYQNDKKVAVHMLCMAEKAGIVKDGLPDAKVLGQKVRLVGVGDNEADQVVNKCAVKKQSPEQTGVQIWICLFSNNVPYYHKL